MIKTLTVTIKDTTEESEVSVRGTRDEAQFNPTVVLVTPMGQVAVNSQDLAKALAEVVTFQTGSSAETKVVAAPEYILPSEPPPSIKFKTEYPPGVTITGKPK